MPPAPAPPTGLQYGATRQPQYGVSPSAGAVQITQTSVVPVAGAVRTMQHGTPYILAGTQQSQHSVMLVGGSSQEFAAAQSALAITAQVLYDTIDWYPEIGDPFSLNAVSPGSYGGALVARLAVILRQQAHGVVLEQDADPWSGALVEQRETAGGVSGSGTTDSRGAYQTGATYVRGNKEFIVECTAGTDPHPSLTETPSYARKRRQVAFKPPAVGVYVCVEADSPRAWYHVGNGTRIRTHHAWTDEQEAVSAAYAGIAEWRRLRRDPRTGILLMLARVGGAPESFDLRTSEDGGVTATARLTVTADTATIETLSDRALHLLLYEDTGDNVWYRLSDDDGATWSVAAACTVSSGLGGGQLTGEVLDMTYDERSGRLYLANRNGAATRILFSDDCGTSWSLAVI